MTAVIHKGPTPVTLGVEQGTAPYPPPPPGVSVEEWLEKLRKEKEAADVRKAEADKE